MLAEDKISLQALEQLFRDKIKQEKPIPSDNDDDIKLGQKYRAYIQASELLNKILSDLNNYGVKPVKKDKFDKEN